MCKSPARPGHTSPVYSFFFFERCWLLLYIGTRDVTNMVGALRFVSTSPAGRFLAGAVVRRKHAAGTRRCSRLFRTRQVR